MHPIILNPSSRDALKNIFVLNYHKVRIYQIESKHRDAWSKDFLMHIMKFDVNGYTMLKQFAPINYVFIHVELDELRKTVFVAELSSFKDLHFADFFNSEALIVFESTDGIPCW